MSADRHDDGSLDGLGAALDAVDPVPVDVIAAAKAVFAARNLDVELAQLVADSAASTAGPVMRGPDVRSLSFEAGDLGIELDIDVKAGLVTGQVTHTGVAVVTLEVDEIEVDRATSDELGRFRLRGISLDAGRASVHVAVDGRSLLCTFGLA